jgi:AcrR family transcriptional regulator
MEQEPKPTPASPKPTKSVNSVRGQENLRDRMISAAEELFLLDGVEGVSMRKIAEKVGVTAPAIYRHFKDKDELLGELINVGLQILQGYLEPALKAEGPLERLEQLIDRYFDFALEQPKYFDLAFLVPSHGMRMADELARHNRSTFMFAVQQVHLCMEQGIFKKSDPLETSIMVWASAHGMVTLFRMERFGENPEQFRSIFQRTIQRMFDGLRPA